MYSRKFVEQIREVFKKLGERILFEPHIVSFGSQSDEFMVNNCISNGKYCAFNMESNSSVTGLKILQESLRQKCIFMNSVSKYFDYMGLFYDKCFEKFDLDCSTQQFSQLKIDPALIDKCVKDSFQNNDLQGENTLLMQDRDNQRKLNLNYFPNIYIDGAIYKGSLDATDLFLSICSSINNQVQEC